MDKDLKLIDYNLQTIVVLSGIILMGVIFLVPTITEKAEADIHAAASGDCGPVGESHKCLLNLVEVHLDSCWIEQPHTCGVWTLYPTQQGIEVSWATKPVAWNFPDEKGFVTYNVDNGKGGEVSFGFSNPDPISLRVNSCNISHFGPGHFTYNKCNAGSGSSATFTYGFRIEGIQGVQNQTNGASDSGGDSGSGGSGSNGGTLGGGNIGIGSNGGTLGGGNIGIGSNGG